MYISSFMKARFICKDARLCLYPCYFMHQSIPAAPTALPPPPPGYCEAFAALVSPGGGAFANFVLPGAGHLPTPRPFLSFCHARCFLSEYNYTDDFTHGKKADWLIRHGQEKLKRL